jgi:hypothetical protein
MADQQIVAILPQKIDTEEVNATRIPAAAVTHT